MKVTHAVRLVTRVVDGAQAEKDGRLPEYVVELLLAYLAYSVIQQAVKER